MNDQPSRDVNTLVTRHLQFAWWSLLCFVILGITLEALHGFKIDWYLGQTSQMRRLMWTLAHAHGTLLALVHAAFAFTYFALPTQVTPRHRLASVLLMASSVLLPGGFFLGGTFILEGDPGLGIWLVPIGGVCLVAAVSLTAVDVVGGRRS
ncbi:MAG: hypothetical protein EXR98_04345 [Gemmataceae bacterium]|nr:hypothetical protein [Gemmataceae bacterium]